MPPVSIRNNGRYQKGQILIERRNVKIYGGILLVVALIVIVWAVVSNLG